MMIPTAHPRLYNSVSHLATDFGAETQGDVFPGWYIEHVKIELDIRAKHWFKQMAIGFFIR